MLILRIEKVTSRIKMRILCYRSVTVSRTWICLRMILGQRSTPRTPLGQGNILSLAYLGPSHLAVQRYVTGDTVYTAVCMYVIIVLLSKLAVDSRAGSEGRCHTLTQVMVGLCTCVTTSNEDLSMSLLQLKYRYLNLV